MGHDTPVLPAQIPAQGAGSQPSQSITRADSRQATGLQQVYQGPTVTPAFTSSILQPSDVGQVEGGFQPQEHRAFMAATNLNQPATASSKRSRDVSDSSSDASGDSPLKYFKAVIDSHFLEVDHERFASGLVATARSYDERIRRAEIVSRIRALVKNPKGPGKMFVKRS